MPLPPLPKKSAGPSNLPKSSGGSKLPALPKAGKDGEKKVRGVLGGFDRAMDKVTGGLMNVAMSAISAPQQAVFKAGQGLGDMVTGHGTVGLRGLGGALGEVLTLGQAGGDIEFAEAIGDYDEATGKHVPKKLPAGVNTAVNVVGDPLNFTTFGAGAVAKSALKAAPEVLGKEAAERLAAQGYKKGLTAAEKKVFEENRLVEAALSGSKKPQKTVNKMVKQLNTRSRGGVTVRIPGTRIAATPLSGEAVRNSRAGALGRAGRDAAKNSKPGKFARAALVPGARVANVTGAKASNELLAALDAKGAAETNRVDDLITRWNSAVKDFESTPGAKFGEEQDRLVSRALQSGDIEAAKAANPELARLIDTGDAIRKGTFEANVEAGTLTDDIARDQSEYMHRTRSPEVIKALGDEAPGGLYEGRGLAKAMSPGSAKARVIAPDSTDHGINEAIDLIRRGEPVPLRETKLAPMKSAEDVRPASITRESVEAGGDEDAFSVWHTHPDGEQSFVALEANADGSFHIYESRVAGSARGQGLGSYLYTRAAEEAAARGGKLVSDVTHGVSDSASATWKSLQRKGYPVKVIDEATNHYELDLRPGGADRPGLVSADDLPAVEALAKKMDAAKLPLGTKYYQESAVASLVESGVEGARAVETARMLDNIRTIKSDNGTQILFDADDLKAAGIEPTKESLKAAGLVEFELPKLGKFYAHPAVKGEITKFNAVIEGDDIVDKSRKAINMWDRWWRGQVTASLPGGVPFGTRNARTNVMLTVADGMPPTYFAKGGDFQWRVRQVVKNNAAEIADDGVEATMKRHLGDRDFRVWKAAREHGVIGDGFYSIDISDAPEIRAAGMPKTGGKLRRGARFVAGSKGTLATKGREFNQAVENHARMSHFLYSIDRLGDLGEAAARTNTVLFDYGRVTPFEQKIMKKPLPFWTFMRKNLPGQMRAFVENPIRVTTPEKLSALVSEPLDDDAPEYQRRAGAHTTRIPGLAGMVLTPERPLQAAITSLEPLAQLAGAVLPGNPLGLEPERGAPQAFRSIASQFGGAPIALGKAIADEASEGSMFTGGRLKPEEMRQRLLKAALPQLGRAPTILSGRLPGAVQESKTKKKAQQKTLAQIAQALGFKIEEQR